MDNRTKQILDSYADHQPNPSVEDQIAAIDADVRKKASAQAIAVGVAGCLLLGIGMSLTMTTSSFFALGIVVGVIGIVVVCVPPVLHKRTLARLRAKARPQVMALAAELPR